MKRSRVAFSLTLLLLITVCVWFFWLHDQRKSRPKLLSEAVQYAALGDSVAAGAGLTVRHDSATACPWSQESYPQQFARLIGTSVLHRACASATARNLLEPQTVQDTAIAPQVDAAFSLEKPNLITITAGANDLRWNELLQKCFFAVCGSTEDTTRVANGLINLQLTLKDALEQIHKKSGNAEIRVLLTGYYNPLSKACVGSQLTNAEYSWVAAQNRALNDTVKQAADVPYAAFVPVDFTGHDICSNDSWLQGFDTNAPLHPTKAGQEAIAKALQQTMQNN